MSLTNKLAQKISSELNYDEEKSAVLRYGVFAFLQTLASLALVAFFGFLLGVATQALVVSFASSILRQYSGGVHATRPSICLIIGTVVTVAAAVLAHYLAVLIALEYQIAINAFLIVLAYYLVIKYAPVDSPAKPIKSVEKRKKMKKFSLIVLSFYLIIVAVLLTIDMYAPKVLLMEYAMCICLAVGWQAFNLTIIGHSILIKFDSIFNKLLYKKRRNLNEKN